MSQVYSTSRATVWHARAEDLLPKLAMGTADLLLLDLPYGEAFSSGRRAAPFGEIAGDRPSDRSIAHEIVTQSLRVLRHHRHLYNFGPADVLEGQRVSATAELIWDKGRVGMGDLSAPWGPAHEPITFAVSVYENGGKSGRASLPARLRKGSVLHCPPPTGRNVRAPNEKPIPLLQELIESSSRIGDYVLDPTAGSGSSGVAAIVLGRKALLIESDERWIPMLIERVAAAEACADAIAALVAYDPSQRMSRHVGTDQVKP